MCNRVKYTTVICSRWGGGVFCWYLVSGACGCAAPSAERFMLIAVSGRVHLHSVVTRDVRLSF